MKRFVRCAGGALAAVALFATTARCQDNGTSHHHHTGTVIKYDSPISHLINPTDMMRWGEDIPSDFD